MESFEITFCVLIMLTGSKWLTKRYTSSNQFIISTQHDKRNRIFIRTHYGTYILGDGIKEWEVERELERFGQDDILPIKCVCICAPKEKRKIKERKESDNDTYISVCEESDRTQSKVFHPSNIFY